LTGLESVVIMNETIDNLALTILKLSELGFHEPIDAIWCLALLMKSAKANGVTMTLSHIYTGAILECLE